MTEQLCAEWRLDKERAMKERKGDRIERRFLILSVLVLSGLKIIGMTQ